MTDENNKNNIDEELIILIDDEDEGAVSVPSDEVAGDTSEVTLAASDCNGADGNSVVLPALEIPEEYFVEVPESDADISSPQAATQNADTATVPEPAAVSETEVVLVEEPEEDMKIYSAPPMSEGEYTTDETVVIPNIPLYEEAPSLETDELEYDDGDGMGIGGTIGVVLNRLLIVFGIFIAIIAVFVGISFLNKLNAGPAETVDFSEVGVNVADIGYIGEENIMAIIEAEGKRMDELHVAMDNYDYNEADEETGVTPLNLTLTTVLKDLKIKIVNGKNKLIANVPFAVEIKDSKGKITELVDEDKDGIVYISDLEGGAYTVKLVALDGYDTLYDFSNAAIQSVNVKSKLDYKAVDVSNEIKTAAQVNTATEDTAEKDTEEESVLKDTVAYVMSTKNAEGNGYAAIDKNTEIKDPIETLKATYETASVSRFSRLRGIIVKTDENGEGGEGGAGSEGGEGGEGGAGASEEPAPHTHSYTYAPAATGTHTGTCSCGDAVNENCVDSDSNGSCDKCGSAMPVAHTHSYTYASAATGTHTGTCSCGDTVNENCVDSDGNGSCDKCGSTMPVAHAHAYTKSYTSTNDGKHNATCECGDVKSEECTLEYVSESGTHKQKCKLCGYETSTTACVDENKDDKCDKCGGKMPVIEATLEMTGNATQILYFWKEEDTKVTATVKFTSGTAEISKYTWSLTGDSIVIDEALSEQTITYTPVKGGSSTLKCEVTLNTGAKVTGMLQVNVTVPAVSLNYTTQKLTFIPTNDVEKEAYKLTYVATMNDTKRVVTDPASFKWTSSDPSVATVDEKGVVVGLKEGTATIRATYKEGDKVYSDLYKEAKVVVNKLPKNDTSTKLVDKNNNPVYVYDSASKSYKQATYADYYSGVTLYKQVDITYKYTGWWTIDGKTYYFDANGKKVTGEQVILGAKYNFDSNGVLKNGTGAFGIDVSSWNGSIDWSKVSKSGVTYAIIRCGFRGSTVGGLVVDSKFETNIKAATDAGIKVGVYFFTQAISETEAVEEASMVLEKVKKYKISYPIFIDVENATNGRANSLSVSNRTAIVKAFCETIKAGGYTPGIYANKTWLSNKLNMSELSEYKIWLAQYATSPTYTGKYDVWQYTESGSITGISGSVDLNLSYMGY